MRGLILIFSSSLLGGLNLSTAEKAFRSDIVVVADISVVIADMSVVVADISVVVVVADMSVVVVVADMSVIVV